MNGGSPMRIALCDDELVILNYLKQKIDAYFKTVQEGFEITMFQSGEELLFKCGDSIPFDLVILDIQMGGMNGLELAKKIRKMDQQIPIIFLTGVADYVFEGYEVGALRYLLKPLKEEQLIPLLEEVRKEQNKQRQSIIITFNREQVKLYLDEIYYMESMGHYLVIHTQNEAYEIKKSLTEMLKELDDSTFVLTHRSYLVNIEHVTKIKKDTCVLANQSMVPVSRSNYNRLNEQFIAYYRR
jgi:DNA-binding LytR/AlgR family response regulator